VYPALTSEFGFTIEQINDLTLEEVAAYSKYIEEKYSDKNNTDEEVLDTTDPVVAKLVLGKIKNMKR
jgi:hypothetical protein